MEAFIDFFSFQDPNVRLVVLGMLFISLSSSLVGSFAFLQKKSLVGDAVAHSLLPGIAIAFMISGSKNPWVLILGALISGWISILIMDFLTKRSKIKTDTSIALVLSVMFGLGILLLTHIQHSDFGNQSGLDKFLFGKAASLTLIDIQAFGLVTAVIVVLVGLFYREFKLLSFNYEFAQAIGMPVKALSFLMNTLLVLSITTGIQAVGVVLMAALLIAPAAAAKIWTYSLSKMILIAMGFALFSSLIGSFVSYTYINMPTGPWIVVILTFFTVMSLLFAPKRGVFSRMKRQRENSLKINTENILKALYHLEEGKGKIFEWHKLDQILEKRTFNKVTLNNSLKHLSKKNWIVLGDQKVKLSKAGEVEARRVVRLHRLWEMYLTKRMNFKSDHIHSNAETIEHIITPEIERELILELGTPKVDPHSSAIPYAD
jgi:manganese/zinc/iron transport system permease protein